MAVQFVVCLINEAEIVSDRIGGIAARFYQMGGRTHIPFPAADDIVDKT